mmetsp:Transcript_18879/g.71970  ORF Transcript_18879/g.71970 Transcript_18879/m.71970 type:complete len:203 (-) Transcript_18879:1227-1835(-)
MLTRRRHALASRDSPKSLATASQSTSGHASASSRASAWRSVASSASVQPVPSSALPNSVRCHFPQQSEPDRVPTAAPMSRQHTSFPVRAASSLAAATAARSFSSSSSLNGPRCLPRSSSAWASGPNIFTHCWRHASRGLPSSVATRPHFPGLPLLATSACCRALSSACVQGVPLAVAAAACSAAPSPGLAVLSCAGINVCAW